jgi:hypothetical protein
MRAGTLVALGRHGFPVPTAEGPTSVHLLMKPTLADDDDRFKAGAHAHVRTLGGVVAAFDNEPRHANDLARSFPEALVVHLATDHSGRDVPLDGAIPSIADFRMEEE